MGRAVSLRIGVIGAGAMGAAHVRTLSTVVPAARVTAIYDADTERARQVAAGVSARTTTSAHELIQSDHVDAVVICSPDFTHAELAKACIAADKPVMCEKPLAVAPQESLSVVEAEVAAGRQYVLVGFMRRFDPAFVALREATVQGRLGVPRVVHCLHRNAVSQTSTSSANLITGSMIHELDTVRWLLDDEVAGIAIGSPIRDGFRDPQLATIDMVSGTLVSVEVFVNATYGYDVRCEVVGTDGTASLAPPQSITYKLAGADVRPISNDFVDRFSDAYRLELNDWVEGALGGVVNGANAWDGHIANVIAAAGVESLESGARIGLPAADRPSLYG